MEEIKVKIVALPTKEASRLYRSTINNRFHLSGSVLQRGGNWENIFIYFVTEGKPVDGAHGYYNGEIIKCDDYAALYSTDQIAEMQKVVSSSDPEVKELPLPTEFLEEYVRATNAGEVMETASIMVGHITERIPVDSERIAMNVIALMKQAFEAGEKSRDNVDYAITDIEERFAKFVHSVMAGNNELD